MEPYYAKTYVVNRFLRFFVFRGLGVNKHREGWFEEYFGERLKAERKRLGLSQAGLAARVLLKPQAQLKYEAGATSPTVTYLYRVARLGVDVHYLLTGKPNPLKPLPEAELVALYRAAPAEVQKGVLAMLRSTVPVNEREAWDDEYVDAELPVGQAPRSIALHSRPADPEPARSVHFHGDASATNVVNGDQHVAGDQVIGAAASTRRRAPAKPRKSR